MGDAKPTQDQILLAKTKALDKYFSDHIEEFANSWDLNFTASILDWQQIKKLHLTSKQEYKLNQVYHDHATGKDAGDFQEGEVYHYEAFL